MVFAEGLNYTTPLQSPETAYIWDVGGQAITSGNFTQRFRPTPTRLICSMTMFLGQMKISTTAMFMRQRRRMQLAGWQWTRALP